MCECLIRVLSSYPIRYCKCRVQCYCVCRENLIRKHAVFAFRDRNSIFPGNFPTGKILFVRIRKLTICFVTGGVRLHFFQKISFFSIWTYPIVLSCVFIRCKFSFYIQIGIGVSERNMIYKSLNKKNWRDRRKIKIFILKFFYLILRSNKHFSLDTADDRSVNYHLCGLDLRVLRIFFSILFFSNQMKS